MSDTMMNVEIFGLNLEFSNVAFNIFGYNIYWYGIIIATGFFAALVYAFMRAKEFKINSDPMIDAILVGAIGAIVCARAYYVVFINKDRYMSFLDMIDIRDGGLAIYGAVIGALVFGGIMCIIRKINVLSMFDLAGIGFLLGQSVGRWGNFMNQEAFGSNTNLPWGMLSKQTSEYLSSQKNDLAAQGIIVQPSLPVHPCFLYESLWCLLGFVLLHFYSRHRRYKGELFIAYITWYGLGRFFIESLRTDSLMWGSIKISQLLAGVCFVAGMILLVTLRVLYNKKEKVLALETQGAASDNESGEIETEINTEVKEAGETEENNIKDDEIGKDN